VQFLLDAFNRELLSGALKPGDQIPTEVELSEQFGVSRNTVREAIKILVAMGVLEIRRPVGTYVCQGFTAPMISPILYGIILGRGNSYDDLMDLREIMETGTMLTVIRNANDEEIASLAGPLDVLKRACLRKRPVIREVFEADNAFHEAIMALSHNTVVEQISRTVRTMTYDMRLESVKLMLAWGKFAFAFSQSVLSIFFSTRMRPSTAWTTAQPILSVVFCLPCTASRSVCVPCFSPSRIQRSSFCGCRYLPSVMPTQRLP
jgi:DNA-binding FadR family transcriptional regulator